MILFEAYLKNGLCVRSDSWDVVDSREVKCLVCYHPFLSGFSVVVEAQSPDAEFFLYKEGIATLGGAPSLVKVVFGKKEAGKILTISFIVGGGVEVSLP